MKRHQKLAEEALIQINERTDVTIHTGNARLFVRQVFEGKLRELENQILGKTPAKELEDCLPVVLYFGNEKDRTEFIRAFKDMNHYCEVRKL